VERDDGVVPVILAVQQRGDTERLILFQKRAGRVLGFLGDFGVVFLVAELAECDGVLVLGFQLLEFLDLVL